MKIEVNINQHTLKFCDTLKYLSFISDCQLNFKQHISKITKQVAKATGILEKARKFLPEKSLLNLYHALFQPHFLLYMGLNVPIWFSKFFTISP